MVRPLRLSRPWPFVIAIAVASMVSCKKEPPPEAPPPPRPIKIYRLAGQSGDARPDYPGRVKALKTVEMSFEVEGRIIDWNVQEGQRVKKGQVLSRIDPRDYQAQLESQRAQLRLAEAEYRRESKLFSSGSGTQRDLDVAIRRRDVARADIRIAQKALNDTKLKALFDGVIARKLVTDYRNVAARESVLLLQDESLLEVIVDVPEGDIAGANKNERADLAAWNEKAKPMVELASIPGEQYPATLKEFATAADSNTRTFRATFLMERPEGINILAGMTTKVLLTGLSTTGPADFLIPAKAVVADSDAKPYVWVVEGEPLTVSKRPIEVGKITGDRIVVTGGIERGDAIAMTGVHLLTEGRVVTEMEKSDETRK